MSNPIYNLVVEAPGTSPRYYQLGARVIGIGREDLHPQRVIGVLDHREHDRRHARQIPRGHRLGHQRAGRVVAAQLVAVADHDDRVTA